MTNELLNRADLIVDFGCFAILVWQARRITKLEGLIDKIFKRRYDTYNEGKE